jgi:hypothetical protein
MHLSAFLIRFHLDFFSFIFKMLLKCSSYWGIYASLPANRRNKWLLFIDEVISLDFPWDAKILFLFCKINKLKNTFVTWKFHTNLSLTTFSLLSHSYLLHRWMGIVFFCPSTFYTITLFCSRMEAIIEKKNNEEISKKERGEMTFSCAVHKYVSCAGNEHSYLHDNC